MKFLNGSTLLTDRYPHVIKTRVYYYRHFLKRHILKTNERIEDAEKLRQLINDYFPGLRFFDIERRTDKKWDIEKYFYKEQGKWILDITAMSKNENYACLFPKDISHWDEGLAKSKYGSADVIRFFIYEQNETFFSKISSLNRTIRFDKKAVPDKFLDEINYYDGTDVWDLWDFFKIVVHNPPYIHKAFAYYARMQYNLLAFALNDTSYNDNDPHNNDIDYLTDRGKNIMNKKIGEKIEEKEHISEMEKLKIKLEELKQGKKKLDELKLEIKVLEKNKLEELKLKIKVQEKKKLEMELEEKHYRFLELEQEILESVPKGDEGNGVPRELEKLIEQLEDRILEINKSNYTERDNRVPERENRFTIKLTNKPYNESDIKKINKLLAIMNKDEKGKMRLWTLYDKVDRLYESLRQPNIGELYTKEEKDSIRKLFHKKYEPVSLDNNPNDDDSTSNLYNATPDEQYLNPENKFIWWLPFFENEFKNELNEKDLKIFLECLPEYYDPDVNLQMNIYSKEELFKTFRILTGIPDDKTLRKLFLDMIKNAINNIKRSEKD